MNDRLLPILSELRAIFEARYGTRLARLVLFGSQARGDADSESDIDVLVVLRDCESIAQKREANRKQIAALCLQYDVVITPFYVTEQRYAHADSPLLQNVRDEGVAV